LANITNSQIKTFFVDPFRSLDLNKLFQNALEKSQDTVFILNYQQLDKGVDAKGKSLGRYRNFKYKNRYTPVDLLLTGAWRGKFTLGTHKDYAEVFSQDVKEDMLVKRYGKDIEGLSKQSEANLAEVIKPKLGEMIKKELGL
jgi:hypothetical protein